MHDHDPRRSQYLVRTSPPQVCDFTHNAQSNTKQQLHQSCQHQNHNQMQHQQYQQHYLQNHHSHQHQQPVKKFTNDSNFIFPDANFTSAVSSSAASCDMYDVDEFEDVDEDQISDLDEEEELRLSYERYRQNFCKQPDVTSQLLEFADMVSADIKKFFGRSKDQEDSCDVYEDKWVTAKSGRELYYADLLRVAQGDSEPASKTAKSSLSSLSSPSSSLSHDHEFDNRSRFSGKRDDSVGMGPLTELFEFGYPGYVGGDQEHRRATSVSRSKLSNQARSRSHKLAGSVVPMHDRKFPESFWREPCPHVNGLSSSCLNRLDNSQHSMLSSSKLPDFSDLVESWQGGIEGMATNHLDKEGAAETPGGHQRL